MGGGLGRSSSAFDTTSSFAALCAIDSAGQHSEALGDLADVLGDLRIQGDSVQKQSKSLRLAGPPSMTEDTVANTQLAKQNSIQTTEDPRLRLRQGKWVPIILPANVRNYFTRDETKDLIFSANAIVRCFAVRFFCYGQTCDRWDPQYRERCRKIAFMQTRCFVNGGSEEILFTRSVSHMPAVHDTLFTLRTRAITDAERACWAHQSTSSGP